MPVVDRLYASYEKVRPCSIQRCSREGHPSIQGRGGDQQQQFSMLAGLATLPGVLQFAKHQCCRRGLLCCLLCCSMCLGSASCSTHTSWCQ
jgi:hypothetical protein